LIQINSSKIKFVFLSLFLQRTNKMS